jgi:hypothetical protein
VVNNSNMHYSMDTTRLIGFDVYVLLWNSIIDQLEKRSSINNKVCVIVFKYGFLFCGL